MAKYSKAPIEEAVFDIRINPPLSIEGSDLNSLYSKVSKSYPTVETQNKFEFVNTFKDGKPPESEVRDLKVVGLRFWDQDRKQAFRCGLDGFSFSRLRPYSGWEICFPEVMNLWAGYTNDFKPHRIKRVALRFVNAIKIPESRFELSDYFCDPPRPPEGLPQTLIGFLSRFTMRYADNYFAIVTLATLESSEAYSSLLLDIDAFAETSLDAKDVDQLKLIFERLRRMKNDIFEKSITPKTKELIK